jgi:glycosyltransferase involved in cell wall biosynthesis
MTESHPPAVNAQFRPELSLVLPCYNEELCLNYTVPPLARTFADAGINLEIVLVDNGSKDGTSRVIDDLIKRGLPVVKAVVPVNRGQGLGITTGFQSCTGRYIGYLCADGQVGPESVLAIYRLLKDSPVPTLAKARRRFRQDGWMRKIISVAFNGLMLVIFPGIKSLDVNGNPKILPADIVRFMELSSEDWFLETEVMLKSRHLRLKVIEINVPGFARKGGKSHVRMATILEFVRNIARYRFGGGLQAWSKRMSNQVIERAQEALRTP